MAVGFGTVGELLDRESELAVLEAAAESACRGEGTLVRIEGEPGVGKSRLLAAAAAIGEARGMTVRIARGTELERELQFGVARQLVDLAPDDWEGEYDRRDRGFEQIERFRSALLDLVFPSRDEPEAVSLMLLVDDVQWADRASLRLLGHLGLRLHELPVAIVVCIRTGEIDAPLDLLEPLRPVLDQRTLRPGPLGEAAIEQLVRDRLGPETDARLVDACARASAGNPFYLVELVRSLTQSPERPSAQAVAEAAPETVLHAILVRLAQLGAAPVALARALAVLGDGTSLAATGELAGLEPAEAERAADALARSELMRPGEPLMFSHPLIGSTLRGDLGAFERARAHREAAAVLARADAPPDRIAAQLLRARPEGDGEVVAVLREGAALNRSRGEPAVAAQLLRRALDEPPGETTLGEILLELAEAEGMAGMTEAVEHLDDALAAIGPGRRSAEARTGLARALHHAGDFARAAEVAAAGLEEIPRDDPLGERLLAAWVAAAMLHAPLHERLAETTAPLIEASRRGELPGDAALCAQVAAWLTAQDDPPATVRALVECAFAGDPLVDDDAFGTALGYAASALVYIDELTLAEPLIDAAVDAAQERGATVALAIAQHFRAYVHYYRGRLGEALADAEHSLELYRAGWTNSAWSTPILVAIHLERGDPDEASRALAVGLDANPQGAERAQLLEASARLNLHLRRAADALGDARAAGEISEGTFGVRSSRMFDWTRLAALAAHAAGRFEEAEGLAADAVARGRSGAAPRQLGTALAAGGVVTGGERGIELLAEAVRVLEGSPALLERAHVVVEHGAALRRAGRREEAERVLRDGLERADAVGASPLVTRAREELQALGLRPRRAARSGPSSLTGSERRVAELAAAGLSTVQISHQLYVTRKTVESHLTQIYRKLEIAGRGELAAALGQEVLASAADR